MTRAGQNNFPPHENQHSPSVDFAAEIREQLRRVLSSGSFSRSRQASHLLSFLVEETLSRNGSATSNNLKEYAIAVHVFGRPATFDPGADNIVRVEVRRVRSKLEKYYAEEGASDPILISIPKGTYVPLFQTRDHSDFDLTGRTISHYELVRRRCVNKWQTTYDANCLHLERPVIVIVPTRLTLENELRRQKLLEGTRGGATGHPNVAAVHDVDVANGRVIIATAGLPGRQLSDVIGQGRPLNGNALRFAYELASAIAAGHQTGAFHGNLNPYAVTFDEAGPYAHILPFGISPLVDIDHPAFEGFRPPEWGQSHEPDLRADVWSFGALVWLACYGVAPPPDQERRDAVPDAGMPPRMSEILNRCLRTDPSLRYANAVEILQHISPVVDKPSAVIEATPAAESRPRASMTIKLTAVLLTALVIAIIAWDSFRPQPVAAPYPRVIVLPFENISGDPGNEPYCRAVAELLAAKLARVPGAEVVSSRSLDPRRDHPSIEFLRKKVGVDYAVEGTLLKVHTGFQASVRLIRVADGGFAWTDTYGGPWSDIAARLGEVAEKSAQSMGLVVQRDQKRLAPVDLPTAGPAYDAWLKGRFAAIEYWNTLLPAHFEDAERRLLLALQLQPRYVDAMVDLGQLFLSAAYPPKGNQQDLLNKAEKLARDAVALDPASGRAQTLLGGVYTDSGRSALAMPHLLRAVELSPHDPNPYNSLSLAYEAMGFWESALFAREKAIERDPLLRGIQRGRVLLLARLGRVEEALKTADTFEPGTAAWGTMVARVYLLTGDSKRAEALLMKTNTRGSTDPSTSPEMLMALARAAQGDRKIARRAVKQFRSSERQRGIYFALLCALAGEKDLLVNEIANHTYYRNYRWLVSEPVLRTYRDYPPYRKLVRDLHEEWQRNLNQLSPALPLQPPKLPDPDQYLGLS